MHPERLHLPQLLIHAPVTGIPAALQRFGARAATLWLVCSRLTYPDPDGWRFARLCSSVHHDPERLGGWDYASPLEPHDARLTLLPE